MVRFSTEVFERSISEFPGFQGSRGSIVRLRIVDFMTYKDVELQAGPNVNLIVGPNGTGKSTIVCAICLALAGKPKILGRASTLKEYIRHGASTATIEIELYNADNPKRNWIVKRVITETNSGANSDWYLNGARASETSIAKLMVSLNIQLDNLCQFLPQDRVQDFARMDKIQLLKSTEKSIDNDGLNGLADKHDRLIELQGKIRGLDMRLKLHEEKLRIETSHNKGLERDVNVYTSREKIKQQMNALNGKKLWLLYQKAMGEFTQLKARYDDLNLKKKAEEKDLRPVQTEIDQITEKLTKVRQEMANTGRSSQNFVETLRKTCDNKVFSTDSDVHKYMAEEQSSEKNEKERQKRLANLREKLASHLQEWEQFISQGDVDEVQLTQEMEQLDGQRLAINNELLEVDSCIDSDRGELRLVEHRLRTVQSELKAMNDFKSSRMKFLARNYPNTARAVEYFANPENLAAANLNGELHQPLILSIYVNDLDYGKIAEKCFPMSDLVAFYVEDKEDVKLLLDAAHSNGVGKISVICHQHPRNFQKPRTQWTEGQMREYGFQKSLIELIEAPDYYMSYLCKTIRPQDVLIGNEKTDMLQGKIMDDTDLRSFYTKVKGYRIGKSMYRPVKHCHTFYLTEATIFTDKINASETDRLKETETRIKQDIESIQRQLKSRMPKRDDLLRNQQNLQARKTELQQRINYGRQCQSKIKQCESMIASTEDEKVDIASVRQEIRRKKEDAYRKCDKSLQQYTDSIEQIAVKWYELNVDKQQINLLQKELIRKQNHLEDAKSKANSLKNEMKTLDNQIKTAADTAHSNKEAAKEKTGQNEPPQDVVKGAVEEADVEKEMNRLNTTLSLMPEMNAKAVDDYRDRQRKIEEMEKTKEELERDLAQLRIELEQTKDGWIGPLKELIQRINVNFGSFFQKINYVGEISLDTGEDENDYAKYGVSIMVKFRASEPLAELVGWKQSGGERAISTALYILSLQELTRVPFRVIDEINQGMDARNEKRFFDLLCSLASGTDTPQYFLLSPKMLPPVDYPDNVDFHIIMNGPHVRVKEEVEVQAEDGSDDNDSEDDDCDSSD